MVAYLVLRKFTAMIEKRSRRRKDGSPQGRDIGGNRQALVYDSPPERVRP